MVVSTDQRTSQRFRCMATLGFSYFNKDQAYEGQMMNYGTEGMCFKSKVALHPGVVVCIRLKNIPRPGACDTNGCGLRCLTLAEAIWCRELPDEAAPGYAIGVKYIYPGY